MTGAPDRGARLDRWDLPLFESVARCPPNADELAGTDHGTDLMFLSHVLEKWLAAAPRGAIRVETPPAERTTAALGLANGSGFLAGSLAKPPDPVLAAGIAEEITAGDGSIDYELTDWGRRGVGVILAAARTEHRHVPGVPELNATQLSGLIAAVLPLVELPDDLNGVVGFGIYSDDDT